jgi:ribosomal protein L11 methylase PrmA
LYIKEDVEKMLREYPKNEAKKTEIQLKHEEYEERLNYAGTVYKDTEKEIIENMQLMGQAYDSIHSNTNKISDTTANTAMNYHKEEVHVNKEDRVFLERKILECEEEEKKLDKQIVRVRNLLNQLSADEEFVITTYYMKKAKWNYVEKEYFDNFEIHKSIKQLQTYRDNAIKGMLEVINIAG